MEQFFNADQVLDQSFNPVTKSITVTDTSESDYFLFIEYSTTTFEQQTVNTKTLRYYDDDMRSNLLRTVIIHSDHTGRIVHISSRENTDG